MFYIFLKILFIYHETQRKAETQAEGEQAPCREHSVGLYPGSPGSRSGPKAGTAPLSPGLPSPLYIAVGSLLCLPVASLPPSPLVHFLSPSRAPFSGPPPSVSMLGVTRERPGTRPLLLRLHRESWVAILRVASSQGWLLSARLPAGLLCCHVSQEMAAEAMVTSCHLRLCPGLNHQPSPLSPCPRQEAGRAGSGVLLGHPVDGDLARCS